MSQVWDFILTFMFIYSILVDFVIVSSVGDFMDHC